MHTPDYEDCLNHKAFQFEDLVFVWSESQYCVKHDLGWSV